MLTVKYFSISGILRSLSITDAAGPGAPALYLMDSVCQDDDGNSNRNCAGVILFRPASLAVRKSRLCFHPAKRKRILSGTIAVSHGIRGREKIS